MKDLLKTAKNLLTEGGYTCVLYDGTHFLTATQRGVQPLLQWMDTRQGFGSYVAADRVVGKAAAYLYVLLGITAVHAGVISRPALTVLERYGIEASFETLVDAIQNRTKDGFCPMERAVWEIDDPQEAHTAILRTLAALRQKQESANTKSTQV